MLNKKICYKCWRPLYVENGRIAELEKEIDNAFNCGKIYCPLENIDYGTNIKSIPPYCPYKLEHLLLDDNGF